MSTVNYHTSRSSNLAALNAIVLNVSTLTGSTIQTTATATTSSIVFSSMSGSTLTTSTMTGNQITISTLTVSSINNGTPGVAAYSTLNVSTLNATSTITTSTITTTSNVGIGTANPTAPLHLYGSGQRILLTGAAAQTYMMFTNATNNVGYIGTGGSGNDMIVNAYSGYNLLFQAGGGEYMRITSTGNVGIGTTAPTGKCHIYGNGQSTGLSDVYSLNISSPDSFNGNGATTVYSESINLKAGDLIWNPSVRVHGARIYIGGGYSINGAQNQGYIGMFTGNVERVRFIDTGMAIPGSNIINFGYDQTKEGNAGKIGYQTFTAGALDIVGAGIVGVSRRVQIWDNLTVQTSIGIGTATPNISLDAWGTNNGIGRNRFFGSQHDADKRDSFYIGRWDSTNANYFLGMKCMVDTTGNIGYGQYNNQTMLSFITWGSNYTDPAESMRIRGDGIIMFTRAGYTSNGTIITSGSNGTLTVSSDRRIKEDIVYVDDTVAALNQINHLKPATYRFIGQPDIYLGFIAQDVEQYIPLAVDGKKHEYQWKTDDKGNPLVDENGDLIYQLNDQGEKLIRPRGLTDRAIIAVQTLAIQELSKTATSSATQIQELSKKNTALEEQLATILARLNAAGIA